MRIKLLSILVCMLMVTIVFSAIGNKANNISFNNPPVANAGGPYMGEEGLEIMFDASASYDPDGDELSYRWDFDADEIWDTDWTLDPIYYYTYGDDYDYLAFVEVTDGIDNAYASSPSFIMNVDPEADAGPDQTVNEGENVTLDGVINDLGFDDLHVFCWDLDMNDSKKGDIIPPRFVPGPGFKWDDGSGARTMVINLSTNSFDVNDFRWKVENGIMHLIYFDPNVWTVEEKVSGTSFEGRTKDWPLARKPWTTDSFTVSMEPDENGKFKMIWTMTLNNEPINKGTIEFTTSEKSINKVITDVIYGDVGSYELWFYVTDDDGGTGEDTVDITVLNLLPNITPFGPFKGKPDKSIEFSATAVDLGSDDLIFTWDFGDDSSSVENVYYNNGVSPDPDKGACNGTFPFSVTDLVEHTYESQSEYTVTLTVEDDNGGVSVYSTKANIPRNRVNSRLLFLKFLEDLSNMFPLMRYILGFQ